MGQALPVQPGQFRQERGASPPSTTTTGPAGEGVLEGVARVPKGQQLHRAPLTGEGEFLELPLVRVWVNCRPNTRERTP